MKWRCTWCGKPHETNDPPCDSCGHFELEKAVVQQRQSDAVETGPTFVWACTNCERTHVKNSPPCSRCGNPHLEKTEQTYEDVDRDLDVPGYFEVGKPYLPVFVLVGVVLALFAGGFLSPTVLPGVGPPPSPDVPGDGSTAAGIDFEKTEQVIHDRLDAERRAQTLPAKDYDAGLASLAEYENRRLVAVEHGDDSIDRPNPSDFDPACEDDPVGLRVELPGPVTSYDDEDHLADEVSEALLTAQYDDPITADFVVEGVDVHLDPTGVIVVYYATC